VQQINQLLAVIRLYSIFMQYADGLHVAYSPPAL
jgi:hypothetical protein